MVELTVGTEKFELLEKANSIKYTKQIADIFDIAAVSVSYTNSFNIPKTPKNTQIMQQLGICGDLSIIPYSKVQVALNDNGFPVVPQGWLRVKQTSAEYQCSIVDGMVDFFKLISNKTMGADLDLSVFDHEKNILTVIESFTNPYYTYIVADYNGKNFAKVSGETGINIDYLVPCFNVGKLFEIVMETFGFTYDTVNIDELNDLYITYPKPPAENITDILYAEFIKGNYSVANPPVNAQGDIYPGPNPTWTTTNIIQGELIDNWKYRVPQDFSYRIDITTEAYVLYAQWNQFYGWQNPVYGLAYNEILKNGQVILSIFTDPFEPKSGSVSIFCQAGDIIERRLRAPFLLPNNYQAIKLAHNSTNLKIYRTNQGDIVLADAFKDFNIKDFIKECFWFCAVTPMLDVPTSHMSFISLKDRLNFSRSVDWSKYYNGRNNETYDSGFAQKNIFAHKYNDPDDTTMNGYLTVEDQNAAEEKTIIESKIYAPEQVRSQFPDVPGDESFNTYKFTIWQRESKEDADGIMNIEYKGLNQRFYFMKIKQSEVSEWRLLSESVLGSETVSQLPYADTTGATYNQIVPDKYARYLDVLNNFRAHDIDLAMGLLDFLEVDMTKPVYFDQEAQYYLLNKLNYTNGQISSGEFIRINKFDQVNLGAIDIQAIAVNGYSIKFRMPILEGYNSVILEDSSAVINGETLEFSTVTISDTYIAFFAVIPFEFYQEEPVLSSFVIKTSNGGESRLNIYDGPDVRFTYEDQSAGTTKTLTANIE